MTDMQHSSKVYHVGSNPVRGTKKMLMAKETKEFTFIVKVKVTLETEKEYDPTEFEVKNGFEVWKEDFKNEITKAYNFDQGMFIIDNFQLIETEE
jgi:hypothetical protein